MSGVIKGSKDAQTNIVQRNAPYEKYSQIMHKVMTFLCFVIFSSFLPFIIFFYIFIRISKKLWMKLLANRFPHLNFVENISVRTLLDTHRNQGIINVLMTINGICDPILIKQALMDHVTEKRDRLGMLRFPKLRAVLVSCWGCYAWRTGQHFQIENHLIYANPKYRGRQLTDYNLQDYVNDIVKKYLSSHLPPWQVIIIPNVISTEPKYCLLIRVHHLLIDDDEPLNIGDFLMLKPIENNIEADEVERKKKNKSPLENIIRDPIALPTLYHRLNDSFSNRWNEFVSDFDPVESPQIFKNPPGFFHFCALLLFSIVSTLKEFSRYVSTDEHEISTYFEHFMTNLRRELRRRRLTSASFTKSIKTTFHPSHIVWRYVMVLWVSLKTFWFKIPRCLFHEFIAFLSCIQEDYCEYPNTLVGFLNNYIPLFICAIDEIVYISKIIYTAPISLLEELFFNNQKEKQHYLQKMSTCGRKVVAWSQPVSTKTVKELATASNVPETVVLLSMTTSCLKDYFIKAGLELPKVVLATARTVSCDTLLSSLESKHGNQHGSGLLCLSLPVGDISNGDPAEDIALLDNEINRVRNKQGVIFALGVKKAVIVKALPSILARVLLNYGSRKFAVTLTEVAESEVGTYRETRWGHIMESFICWRPPQGNICISLTIQRYAGTVRLGVMADALLAPVHAAPAKYWDTAIKSLLKQSHSKIN